MRAPRGHDGGVRLSSDPADTPAGAAPPRPGGEPSAPPPADAAEGVAFHPVVDLESGAVLAVEAVPEAGADPDRLDGAARAEALRRSVRGAAALESLLPLVITVPAAVLSPSDDALPLLERELRRSGRRPRDVTLMLGPGLAGVAGRTVLDGVHRLRGLGFRCGFGTAAVPPPTLSEAAPFLVRLDSEHVAGVPHDEARTALIEGVARIALGAGTFPLAAGVHSLHQVVPLRRLGVRLAQGPLFSPDGWQPGDRVRPLPDSVMLPTEPATGQGPRVAEFMGPAATMGEDATAEEVLGVFTGDTARNSVILLDKWERPVASLDRVRFLLAISGPYGHALHARRPAVRLADAPRTVGRGLPALTALRAAGADRDRVYDDMIVVNEFGQCMGTVHVKDLISSMSQ